MTVVDGLLQMTIFIALLGVMSPAANLQLIPGVLAKAAADEELPGAYPRYINKHNYGYVLKYDREINIATYDARLIFHMILPDWNTQFNFRPLDCRSHVNGLVAVICGRMHQIRESVRRVYAYNLLYVQHQVRRVYEVIQDVPIRQRTRTARGVLTDILSRATGLASRDDLKGVENILEQIQKGVLEASRLWGDGAKSLSAALKIEQDRMRNVFNILGEYRQEIRSL